MTDNLNEKNKQVKDDFMNEISKVVKKNISENSDLTEEQVNLIVATLRIRAEAVYRPPQVSSRAAPVAVTACIIWTALWDEDAQLQNALEHSFSCPAGGEDGETMAHTIDAATPRCGLCLREAAGGRRPNGREG